MEENNQVIEEKKGLSITAMILGIVSIVLCKMVFLSVPCAILAIIFGVIENKKHKNGFAKSGFILGIISIIFTIVLFIISMSLYSSLFDTAKDAVDNYKQTEKKTEKETEKETEESDSSVTVNGKTYNSLEEYIYSSN